MRLEFQAVEGSFEDENDATHCLICGVLGKDAAGVEHYLVFQRSFEDEEPSEDWGIHCEFDDQVNGAYHCVSRCRLSPMLLEVDLTRPIDWQKKYTGVSVDVSGLDDATLAAMRAGLTRIFRGIQGVLEISEPDANGQGASCVVVVPLGPTYDAVTHIEHDLPAMADPCGGRADGWRMLHG